MRKKIMFGFTSNKKWTSALDNCKIRECQDELRVLLLEKLEEEVMAGATVTFLPALLVFLILQKYFVQGIALTGLKG